MLRMRRYRVFLIFAVFAIAILYHFRKFGDLENAGAASVDELRNFGLKTDKEDTAPSTSSEAPAVEQVSQDEGAQGKGALEKEAQDLRYNDASTSKAPSEVLPASTASPSITPTEESTSSITSTASPVADEEIVQKPANFESDQKDASGSQVDSSSDSALEDPNEGYSEGRQDTDKEIRPTTIHWSSQSEHFPVPSSSIIQLPTGRPKAIPKIQHVFNDESANDKIDREQKIDMIRKTFAHSWAGYKKKAWMQDELSPVSGNYRNPFCGWAATLVDSLDSLWILGMKEEFEEATNALKNIDFTTTDRNDIPLFETVIRYLGGLIAAYDLSNSTYRILLDKAIELAEILMGAFDTPNRMPMTFYLWKPTFASQPHRARTRTVLAELGSLSLEFTRLAQITRQPKYYDAVARITSELEIWQNNTRMPGLWPLTLDASGCKKPDISSTSQIDHSSLNGPGAMSERVSNSSASSNSEPNSVKKGAEAPMIKTTIEDPSKSKVGVSKRQFYDANVISSPDGSETDTEKQPDCELQGLASPPGTVKEEFSLGGMADSVYEYLPKQYMLLGGLEDVHRRMYEAAIETTKSHLLFRPMLPGDRNVLLSGMVKTSGNLSNPRETTLQTEGTHLTCFAGGMFAIGAKIFNRDSDMEIAKKLTDGCVWAYESTTTGIMPEHYLVLPCKSQETCAWNKTLYYEALDPSREAREETRKAQQQQHEIEEKEKTKHPKNVEASPISKITSVAETTSAVDATSTAETIVPDAKEDSASKIENVKRQLGDITSEVPLNPADMVAGTPAKVDIPEAEPISMSGDDDSMNENPKNDTAESKPGSEPIAAWTDNFTTPPHISTHEEFVEAKIKNDRLPTGMTNIIGYSYILRPEAIESVFIMYRTTGDSYWREKGWSMFQAIHKHTNATYGASAIYDVTQENPRVKDEMESFWLAETLKYFFLLFSDPSEISLDDYVLNTEAHPFKRPRAT